MILWEFQGIKQTKRHLGHHWHHMKSELTKEACRDNLEEGMHQ